VGRENQTQCLQIAQTKWWALQDSSLRLHGENFELINSRSEFTVVTKPLHLLDIDGAVAELGLVRIFL
jgi:hypothetical protein